MTITKQPLLSLSVEPTAHPGVHYYDEHPTEEDLMGESIAQRTVISYLEAVLTRYAPDAGWFITSNFNLYRDPDRMAYPVAPDLAIFKGVTLPPSERIDLLSWRLYRAECPPPRVVFEISSDATWHKDLEQKPAIYAAMGVQEYYAYDPNRRPNWPPGHGRLRGWHADADGKLIEQATDAQGRLWSPELASWLVPAGVLLRCFDDAGVMRLTEGEAERAAKEQERQRADAERQRADAERQRAEQERQRANAERTAKEQERQRADAERERANAERQRADAERQRADAERAAKEQERQRADAERAAKEQERQRADRLAAYLKAQGFDLDQIG